MGSNRTVKTSCVVYRPQNRINSFIEDLDKVFAFLSILEEETLIFGDFNIDTLKPSCEKTQYEIWKFDTFIRIQNSKLSGHQSYCDICHMSQSRNNVING